MPDYFYLRDAPNSARVIEGLQRLRAQLDAEIPVKSTIVVDEGATA